MIFFVLRHDASRNCSIRWLLDFVLGHRLVIEKVSSAQARVDFLDPTGNPVRRTFMDDAPAVEMLANYDDYNGIFGVELWERGKNFVLDLTHEQAYDLDEQRRESLVPGLITNEGDRYLQRYFELFPLRHFVRAKRRTTACTERRRDHQSPFERQF